MTIGFIGNPNCGKTTLFNAYTGANLKVANWPGVTVEKVEGQIEFQGQSIHLVDLPGTYSLTSYTMEETVSRSFILSDEVDVIINVVDASALERSLYLTLQLLELGKPVVMALNMMDIVEKRGMEIDLHRFPEMLGIPVVPVSARKRRGLDVLMHAAIHHKDQTTPDRLIHEHSEVTHHAHDHHSEFAMVYSDEIEDKIDQIIPELERRYPNLPNYRWHAIKLLESDKEICEKYPVNLPEALDRSYESDVINQKYDFIGEIISEVLLHKQRQDVLTEKADAILTSKIWGIPVFLGIMALTFLLTFTLGDWLKGWLELLIDWLSGAVTNGLAAVNASAMITSLVVDGIIAGVGTIVTFLPNILILFLCLALLEDSGYMARVAFVMDKPLRRLGLSGRSFVPMLMGFGCSVPAIMASRTLSSERDRKMTILLVPFMSCSAKLPIYGLLTSVFFPPEMRGVVVLALYLLGMAVGVLYALALKRFKFTGEPVPFVMELPNYRLPSAKSVLRLVWDKAKGFIQKAFTVVFLATLVIWFLQTFDAGLGLAASADESLLALIGGAIAPAFAPLGFGDWRASTALLTGFMAKESVVSTLTVLVGGVAALQEVFTPFTAFVFLVFTLLYTPCVAAIATVKKETNGRTAAKLVVSQCVVAWVVAFCIRAVGLAFGLV